MGPDGKLATTFHPEQTKLMHFFLIRSDLSGYQHVHPTLADDGTWTVPLGALEAGTYRAYAQFTAQNADGSLAPVVLGQQITVPGTAVANPLPPPSTVVQADGYTLTLAGQPKVAVDKPGQGMGNSMAGLDFTVSKDGKPVTDLEPYLGTYAHLTAIHEGDLAFAHIHPKGKVEGDHGGPHIMFSVSLMETGNWHVFLQFQTHGVVHTAALTLIAG